MFFLKENPMIRLLLPMILGILSASYVPINPLHILMILVGFICVTILFECVKKSEIFTFRFRFVPGVLLSFFMFFCGLGLNILHAPQQKHAYFGIHLDAQPDHLLIRVNELWSERQNSFRSTAEVIGLIDSSGLKKNTQGKIMLYVFKSDSTELPQPGSLMIAENRVNDIAPRSNPHAFDYKTFLAREGIHYQMFLRDGNWQSLSYERARPIDYIIRLRAYLLSQLKVHVHDESSLAVASALLLGYRDYIPPELRDAYAGSGAMHILAVSGLHVGIIFLVFKMMTSFLLKLPHGKLLQAVVIISLIWVFACLTGLAPSVRRASTMFTMITIGVIFFKKTSIYNIIGGSAFILLIFSPNLIHAIGFQLSYGAVIAIIAIQPKLYQLLTFDNFILDKTWALITVSFAAQMGTAPLTLYYFNIFPNYFLLTNIIVIPVASLILYTGMLFFALHPLMNFGVLIGEALNLIIWGLNFLIQKIQWLPYSVSEQILLLKWEKVLLFGFVFFFFQILNGQIKRSLAGMLVLLMLFQLGRLGWNMHVHQESYLRVYQSGQETWIEKRKGHISQLYANGSNQTQNFQFNVNPALFKSGIRQIEQTELSKENYLFSLNYKKVLRADSTFFNRVTDFSDLPQTDLLIIHDVERLPLSSMLNHIQPEAIIFAASFSFHRSQAWLEICEKEDWNCYFAALEGAITYYPKTGIVESFLEK